MFVCVCVSDVYQAHMCMPVHAPAHECEGQKKLSVSSSVTSWLFL